MKEHRTPVAEPLKVMTRGDTATENGDDNWTETSMQHAEDGSRWKRCSTRANGIRARGRCSCRASAGGPGGWIKPEDSEKSLINNKREKGGGLTRVTVVRGKTKERKKSGVGSRSVYTKFFSKKPGFSSKPLTPI
jgi:hypothetical protein